MDQKLRLNLEYIGKVFGLAGDDEFIAQLLRDIPEHSMRFVLESVKDDDLAAYLEFFEGMQEYEWCRVIALVMTERRAAPR
ncbi:hypothetical protein [Mucilaginibacter sp.]|uniref:hypothetical protein n=1 Tax=Mucilaginibacter sp. TaxID=1882438 RepID=UPI003D0B3571